MQLLTVTLYEFGQFLRILLWISIPTVILAMLITTYVHYRNKRLQKERDRRAKSPDDQEGFPDDQDWIMAYPSRPGNEQEVKTILAGADHDFPAEAMNPYQGLLWMKDKYEQYREATDRKYERLKDELMRSEQKYFALLASRPAGPQIVPVNDVDTNNSETGETVIARLTAELAQVNERLHQEMQRSQMLMEKLQDNSHLLMRIYKELDNFQGIMKV
jgi:hypothetical protein